MADAPAEARLEEELSRPSAADVALMARLEGDILVLGVAGKMGPTLARLARRATDAGGKARRIIGVARFTESGVRRRLEAWGVATLQAELLDRQAVASLPDAPNVVFMAGRKFGTAGHPAQTWAANTYLPALVADRFRESRIVVFSSGNVYPLSGIAERAPSEADSVGPVGEYAQSVLGRERLFHFFSERFGTHAAILRLNYAVEPRYGVLRDIADKVYESCPVDLSMGYVNVIWQRDANSIALRLLEHCSSPPLVLNVTGTEALRVRSLAERFGAEFGVEPVFRGGEGPTTLLSDASACAALFGEPPTGLDAMVGRIARWVRAGGTSLGKPTHFEERAGRF